MSSNSARELSDRYESLRDRLLLYAGDNARVVDSGLYLQGDGVVLHGKSGAHSARHLRNADFSGTVLWDPERYLRNSEFASAALFGEDDEAATNQKALGVDAFLSPSSFPPRDDSDALKKLLDAGNLFLESARSVDAALPGFVVLPLGPKWFRSWSDRLIADVEQSGLPVALVLAASRDPLDRSESIQTLLEVISVAPHTIMLRCDLSAIGGVACGALAGAIGLSSSVRHLYIPTGRTSMASDDPGYLFVPGASNWMKWATLRQIPADHPATVCTCRISEGRSVVHYLDNGVGARHEIELHDVASWRRIQDEILGEPSQNPRAQLWRDHCKRALRVYESLKSEGIEVGIPGFLVGWSAWRLS